MLIPTLLSCWPATSVISGILEPSLPKRLRNLQVGGMGVVNGRGLECTRVVVG